MGMHAEVRMDLSIGSFADACRNLGLTPPVIEQYGAYIDYERYKEYDKYLRTQVEREEKLSMDEVQILLAANGFFTLACEKNFNWDCEQREKGLSTAEAPELGVGVELIFG